MSTVDLNCDMGEGMDNDEDIMPFISSANIACGYHAGDENTVRQTIMRAGVYGVNIGAHPSFYDRENFGRKEIHLSTAEIYDLVTQQLVFISKIATSLDQQLHHVKPHGALYNMSARDATIAKTIAAAVKDFDQTLILFGLSGSHSIHEGLSAGLRTSNEVFADRTYQDNGALTARSESNALIEEPGRAVEQVMQIIKESTVTTISGKKIAIAADTICIHGDGKKAALFAKTIHQKLKENNIGLRTK